MGLHKWIDVEFNVENLSCKTTTNSSKHDAKKIRGNDGENVRNAKKTANFMNDEDDEGFTDPFTAASRRRIKGQSAGSNVGTHVKAQAQAEKEEVKGFPVDEKLNQKIYLVKGPHKVYAELDVEAIVNRTNERLNDWSGLSNAILKRGGPELKEECSYVPLKCQTGEAKITRGCQLNAKFVIHTVGPKYTEQYQTAAETALHHCYRSCISLAKEQNLKSIAFPCIYSEKKQYPREQGADVAVRTIRRFLEHFPDGFTKVILYLENDQDLELYKKMLALYFPRNEKELKWSIANLPKDVGNEWGEIEPEERKIRISSSFCSTAPVVIASTSGSNGSISPSNRLYEEVVYGTDTMLDNENYKGQLKRANELDLKDVLALNIIYHCGQDLQEREIIVFVVENMNGPDFDADRLFLYCIRLLDSLVTNPNGYVIVLVDTEISIEKFPSLVWLQSLYNDVIGRKYKKNIKAMYVLHPSWQLKALFWGAMPFVSSKFWDKHHYCETLDDLYRFIPADYLLLPQSAYKADAKAIYNKAHSWF